MSYLEDKNASLPSSSRAASRQKTTRGYRQVCLLARHALPEGKAVTIILFQKRSDYPAMESLE